MLDIGDIIFLNRFPETIQPSVAQLFIRRRLGNKGSQVFNGIVDSRTDCTDELSTCSRAGETAYRKAGKGDVSVRQEITA
jgi:hypothetical protein